MYHRLRKRGTTEHENGREEISVEIGQRREHRRRRGHRIIGRRTFVHTKDRQAAVGKTQYSIFDP